MQLPFFLSRALSVPVKNPVSNIRCLLNFNQDYSSADCMYPACRGEEGVSGIDDFNIQELFDLSIPESLFINLPGNPIFESRIYLRAFFALKDIPHLCFSIRTMSLSGQVVVGMDLDRKNFLSFNKLD